MTPAIQATDVRKRLGSTQALAGVSIELGDGITGLLGPNGAGKTTLMRVLATVLAADAGGVRLLGARPGRPRRRAPRSAAGSATCRRSRAFTSASRRSSSSTTSRSSRSMTVRRERHDEVRRVLDLVGLEDVMGRAHQGAVGRHAPARRARPGAARRSAPADPRRADRGPGSRAAAALPRAHLAPGGGPLRADLHAPDRGRGRALPAASSSCATARRCSTARRASSPRSRAVACGCRTSAPRARSSRGSRRRRAPPQRRRRAAAGRRARRADARGRLPAARRPRVAGGGGMTAAAPALPARAAPHAARPPPPSCARSRASRGGGCWVIRCSCSGSR